MKFIKGLYKDCEPIDQPDNTYRDARNAILTRQQGSVANEGGTINKDSLPSGHQLLGSAIAYDGTLVLFSVKFDGTGSTIATFDGDTYTSVLTDDDLNFPYSGSVQAFVIINNKQEKVVYWTDGVNPPRYYNIETTPAYNALEEFNIFATVTSAPKIGLDSIDDGGGSLSTGSYYFAVAYEDQDGNRTNFLTVSPPVYLNDDSSSVTTYQQDGAPAGTPTSKSIRLKIENIDTAYENMIVAVIPNSANVFSTPQLLPARAISGSTETFNYSGNETTIESSIDEIFANRSSYSTVKTMNHHDGVMYMGNLTRKPDIGFQPYANNIKLKLVEVTASEYIYARPEGSFALKGYQRDGVYAFYVSFVLKNGEESMAYHIPGREAVGTETDVSSDSDVTDIISDGKNFQFESIADGTYGMGYWENENELYPADPNWDVYDVDGTGNTVDPGAGALGDTTLQGTPVRHHHFPDAANKPFYNGDGSGQGTIEIAAFRLEDVKLPPEIKEQVVGMKVYYAERTRANRRIFDQAASIPLKTLTVDGELAWSTDLPNKNETTVSKSVSALGFVPFYTMRSGANIGPLTHISGIGIYNGTATDNGTYNEGTLIRASDPMTPVTNGSRYRRITAKAIGDNHKALIDLKSKGFSYNGRTFESEAKLFAQLNSPITIDINVTTGAGAAEWDYAYNLCSHKIDMYDSFDQQELVFTGYLETNMDWFDPTTPTPTTDSGSPGSLATYPTVRVDVINNTIGTTGDNSASNIGIQYTGSVQNFSQYDELTKTQIADRIVTQINTVVSGISAVNLGGTNPTIEITSITPGTVDNGKEVAFTVPSVLEENGLLLSTYSAFMSGGEDGVEPQAARTDFETATVMGGDTYIGLLGLRYTEEDPTAGTERKIILYHPVESLDNVLWRHEGSNNGELYYPKSTDTAVFQMEEDDAEPNIDVFYTNYFGYDPSYSSLATLKTAIPLPKQFTEVTDFPTRIIRGQQTQETTSGLDTAFRTFLANDYLDLPNKYGELTRISIVNNIIVPHMNSGILRTKGREELVTGDIRAFIGAGDIFSVRPDDLISVEEGYGGLQDIKAAISTEYGYYFVDQQNKEIFELAGDGLAKLSEKGIRNFLREHIDSTKDMNVVYDPKYDRVLFSQSDWTLSYYPTLGAWGSRHDYFPDRLIKGKTNFYSTKGLTIYEHNDDTKPGYIYGEDKPFDIEFIHNDEYGLPKHYMNVAFITRSINQDILTANPGQTNYPEFKDTFDQLRMYNDYRDTGMIDLVYFDQVNGNLRNVEGIWRVNKLRDLITPEYTISGTPVWGTGIFGISEWEETFTGLTPHKNYRAEITISSGTGDVDMYATRANGTYDLIGTSTYDASGGSDTRAVLGNIGDSETIVVQVTGSTAGATVSMDLKGYDVPDPDKVWNKRGRFIGPFTRVLLRYNNVSNNLLSLSYATASYKKSIR